MRTERIGATSKPAGSIAAISASSSSVPQAAPHVVVPPSPSEESQAVGLAGPPSAPRGGTEGLPAGDSDRMSTTVNDGAVKRKAEDQGDAEREQDVDMNEVLVPDCPFREDFPIHYLDVGNEDL